MLLEIPVSAYWQAIVCRVDVCRVSQNFILGCLNRSSSANLCCKPLPGKISVQNIPHGLVYPAGFAGYITLAIYRNYFDENIEETMDWIVQNKEWFMSGIGVALIGWIGNFLFRKKELLANQSNTTQSVVVNNIAQTSSANGSSQPEAAMSLADRKFKTRILFIDDDTKFKVVKILTKSGWINTSIIKDANTLDEPSIIDAHILFVDVQGVGVAMGFDSEGLGLALALKEKYRAKKIIIYSAETNGNRFHEALRKADSFLPKNADPYEFQKLVEELSAEIAF